MASVHHLIIDLNAVIHELHDITEEIENKRRIYYTATRVIQAHARGYLIRKYIKALNAAATMIQKVFRGYSGRKRYRRILKQAVQDMYQNYFHNKATIIQKTWRGHWVRSQGFSFIALNAWLNKVKNKNDEILEHIRVTKEKEERIRMEEFEMEARKWVVFILFKLHHLLRTKVKQGIYSKKYTLELSNFEKLLKTMEYKKYMDGLRQHYIKFVKTNKPQTKTDNVLPGIGCTDTYWYYNQIDLFNLVEDIKNSQKSQPTQSTYDKSLHPKDFDLTANLTCSERKDKMWTIDSVFLDSNDKSNMEFVKRSFGDVHLSKLTKLNRKPVPTEFIFKYVDYQINALQMKKCSIHKFYENNIAKII